MRKIIRFVACIFLVAIGLGLTVFSVIIAFEPIDWALRGGLLAVGAFGVVLASAGVAIMRGAPPREIMRDLFAGLLGL